MQVSIDKYGRLVLPKHLRDAFGLGTGGVVEIEESAEAIVLRPVPQVPPVVEEEGVLVVCAEAEAPLEDAVKKHRIERISQSAAGGV